jgi:hypothetical protein
MLAMLVVMFSAVLGIITALMELRAEVHRIRR